MWVNIRDINSHHVRVTVGDSRSLLLRLSDIFQALLTPLRAHNSQSKNLVFIKAHEYNAQTNPLFPCLSCSPSLSHFLLSLFDDAWSMTVNCYTQIIVSQCVCALSHVRIPMWKQMFALTLLCACVCVNTCCSHTWSAWDMSWHAMQVVAA